MSKTYVYIEVKVNNKDYVNRTIIRKDSVLYKEFKSTGDIVFERPAASDEIISYLEKEISIYQQQQDNIETLNYKGGL